MNIINVILEQLQGLESDIVKQMFCEVFNFVRFKIPVKWMTRISFKIHK